ncbi:hypothetical protein [Paragemmobacter straminiformis]|uniref:Uncharacterized protein n=1 Tax=Paragemmobacter straminiformis TaxID=2045119 RepID=A0A842IGQ5_9RHOB|nr:hypothetical protein [Gemmobacter straminiformis]MBC2837618.1 hypothetical protein [Gemmobacter straminiformis]
MSDDQFEHDRALRIEEDAKRVQVVGSSDYWTLAQAAAWVVFREVAVVERFAPPNADHWGAFLGYATGWGWSKRVGRFEELVIKLCDGRLTAFGQRTADGAREAIPASTWIDLVPDVDAGPYICLPSGAEVRPWFGILIRSADVERLWRRTSEVEGRSKFSKEWFRERFRQLRAANPDRSKNELMEDLNGQFQDETKRKPPARSTLQGILDGLK